MRAWLFFFNAVQRQVLQNTEKKLHRDPQNKIGAKFLVVVVNLPTCFVSMLFLCENQLVYGVLQLLMEEVLSSLWVLHQNSLTYVLSHPTGKTDGSCPSTTSFVFRFRRSLSRSLTWWSDLHQNWTAVDYSVGNAVQYEEKNLWHRCWAGQELNRYFISASIVAKGVDGFILLLCCVAHHVLIDLRISLAYIILDQTKVRFLSSAC